MAAGQSLPEGRRLPQRQLPRNTKPAADPFGRPAAGQKEFTMDSIRNGQAERKTNEPGWWNPRKSEPEPRAPGSCKESVEWLRPRANRVTECQLVDSSEGVGDGLESGDASQNESL